MQILVYEYISSGVLAGQAIDPSLKREGLAMVRALVTDLANNLGLTLVLPLDPSLLPGWPPGVCPIPVQGQEQERQVIQEVLKQVDAAIFIAPEFGGILEERCCWCEEAGVPLLGPASLAVRMASDKQALANVWHQAGVPTPPCLDQPTYPCVLKPRDGAGSQATFLLHSDADLRQATRQASEEGWQGPLLLQQYVVGEPVSVAFLLGTQGAKALPAVRQRLSVDGRFHYLGGQLPLLPNLDQRARHLAWRAISVVPGLRGYVGVDLVLGETDMAIEINPRLTTSYVGYRALARFNLAQALLARFGLATFPTEESWTTEEITFTAGGDLLPVGTIPRIIS